MKRDDIKKFDGLFYEAIDCLDKLGCDTYPEILKYEYGMIDAIDFNNWVKKTIKGDIKMNLIHSIIAFDLVEAKEAYQKLSERQKFEYFALFTFATGVAARETSSTDFNKSLEDFNNCLSELLDKGDESMLDADLLCEKKKFDTLTASSKEEEVFSRYCKMKLIL